MPYTDFHYTPTGTGVISGREVLEQTEDAINDLGTQISGDVQTAIDTANNALNTANTASADAQNAVNTANTAYTAAQNAQNTANTAQNTASNALTAAQNAQNDVNALGNRVTTAENNISQNTTDISGLTTRMGTAENNISTLQNDVVTAQGTATSAQNTATMARQQAYVLRYSSTAITDNSTIAYSTLDNTDNIKASDKIIDTDGKIFSVVSVDSANETVTVETALIDLALDSNVVHTNRNDDVSIPLNSTTAELGVTGGSTNITFLDKNNQKLSGLTLGNYESSKLSYARLNIFDKGANNNEIQDSLEYSYVSNNNNAYLRVSRDNFCSLGSTSYRWKGVYATNYYYGANNVEFSTKFVTTDTAQTITEIKTFTNTIKSQKEIEFTGSRSAYILPEFSASYSGLSLCTYGSSGAVKIGAWKVDDNNNTKHVLDSSLGYLNVTAGSINSVNSVYLTPRNSTDTKLGDSTNKWREINGLTPSSLGMPVAPSSTSYVDISGYITVLDSSSANTYTPPSNGYITFTVTGNLVQIFHDYGLQGKWSVQAGSTNRGFIPVLGGVEVKIYVTASTVDKFWFIPCQGNV